MFVSVMVKCQFLWYSLCFWLDFSMNARTELIYIWATARQNQQNDCAFSKDSGWVLYQSDQSLCCPPEESMGPMLPIKRTAKTLIRLPRLIWVFTGHTGHFVGLSCSGPHVFSFQAQKKFKHWVWSLTLKQLSHLMTKPTKWHMQPAKTQNIGHLPSLISLRCPHEESLCP